MAPNLLDESGIESRLGEVDWQREGNELVKQVTLADFAAALAWVNRVGAVAEERNHHPDIAISWNKVTLHLSTHSAGWLTDMDFEVARAVDAIGT